MENVFELIKAKKIQDLNFQKRLYAFFAQIHHDILDNTEPDIKMERLYKTVSTIMAHLTKVEMKDSRDGFWSFFFFLLGALPNFFLGPRCSEFLETLATARREVFVQERSSPIHEKDNTSLEQEGNEFVSDFLLLIQEFVNNRLLLISHLYSFKRSQLTNEKWHELHQDSYRAEHLKLRQSFFHLCNHVQYLRTWMEIRIKGDAFYYNDERIKTLYQTFRSPDFNVQSSLDLIYDKGTIDEFCTIRDALKLFLINASRSEIGLFVTMIEHMTFKKHSAVGVWYYVVFEDPHGLYQSTVDLYLNETNILPYDTARALENILEFWNTQIGPSYLRSSETYSKNIKVSLIWNKVKRWCVESISSKRYYKLE